MFVLISLKAHNANGDEKTFVIRSGHRDISTGNDDNNNVTY